MNIPNKPESGMFDALASKVSLLRIQGSVKTRVFSRLLLGEMFGVDPVKIWIAVKPHDKGHITISPDFHSVHIS